MMNYSDFPCRKDSIYAVFQSCGASAVLGYTGTSQHVLLLTWIIHEHPRSRVNE